MRVISNTLRLWTAVAVILLAGNSVVLARSWSYHYHPVVEGPTAIATPTPIAPAAVERSAEAKLLKLAIVSDLAIYVQEQTPAAGAAYHEHMKYVTGRLSRFDTMNSPGALKVFASLNGYYLGAPAEKLYYCLALRKGKPLESYLEEYLHSPSAECLNDLGQSFTKPSAALDGYAVCRSPEQQTERMQSLIADIHSGRSCTNSELTGLTSSARR
jgi:hypothetical protein